MAEINKLSVGQALEKLRGTDVSASKQGRLDDKMDALDEEIQRSRATRRRLERDQRAAESTERDAQGANAGTVNKGRFSITTWLAILAIIGLLILIILYATQ